MIATCVQCVLIYGLSATEAIIIGRYLTKAVVDCCWYIFQDGRRVVRFLVDVQWIFPGLLYGLCLPLLKLSVTSSKLTIVVFASMVILRAFSRKILRMPFFVFSTKLGDLPLTACRHHGRALLNYCIFVTVVTGDTNRRVHKFPLHRKSPWLHRTCCWIGFLSFLFE